MESWLSSFWSHLHTAEGLRQTIEVGGILWINSLVWLGHWLGGTPLADQLHKVILIVVVVSFIPVVWTAVKRLLTSPPAPRT